MNYVYTIPNNALHLWKEGINFLCHKVFYFLYLFPITGIKVACEVREHLNPSLVYH